MSQPAEIWILAEDVRHRKLLRRHLRKRGYAHRTIHDVPWFPTYLTPCLKFVREQYPVEVKALRAISTRRSGALIVVADADNETVDERINDLENHLSSSGETRRASSEPIIIVVPRRNIETWMHYLEDNTVDEETDYKPLCKTLDNGESARKFADFTWPRRPLPENCPPSLRHACEVELRRLP